MNVERKRAICPSDGLQECTALRGSYSYNGLVVPDVLAWVCPVCQKAVGFPHSSSGHIAKAVREASTDLETV